MISSSCFLRRARISVGIVIGTVVWVFSLSSAAAKYPFANLPARINHQESPQSPFTGHLPEIPCLRLRNRCVRAASLFILAKARYTSIVVGGLMEWAKAHFFIDPR